MNERDYQELDRLAAANATRSCPGCKKPIGRAVFLHYNCVANRPYATQVMREH